MMTAKEFLDQKIKNATTTRLERIILGRDNPNTFTKQYVICVMEEYSKVQNQELINFLLEIEAWLTFNQTPDAKNTTALRDDIKILVGKYE